MFKCRLNGTSRDRVNRANTACVACPDGSPLIRSEGSMAIVKKIIRLQFFNDF